MKVNEDNYETIRTAEEITGTNNVRWFDAENIEGYIEMENLLGLIEDLIAEYHRLEEELEDKVEAEEPDEYKAHRDNVACGYE